MTCEKDETIQRLMKELARTEEDKRVWEAYSQHLRQEVRDANRRAGSGAVIASPKNLRIKIAKALTETTTNPAARLDALQAWNAMGYNNS